MNLRLVRIGSFETAENLARPAAATEIAVFRVDLNGQ
jgi:hypothetical protein